MSNETEALHRTINILEGENRRLRGLLQEARGMLGVFAESEHSPYLHGQEELLVRIRQALHREEGA